MGIQRHTGIQKDIRDMLRRITKQGFTITRHTRSSHMRVAAPDGRWATVPGTPSGPRSVHEVRSKLRRLGAAL